MKKPNRKMKEQIKKWLSNRSKENLCPFPFDFDGSRLCNFCKSWFPRISKFLPDACPCYVYSKNYVVRRAKEMLKVK